MKKERMFLNWGLTAFCVICGVMLFYDLVFRDSTIMYYGRKLTEILAPVLYGVFIAYLLTPVVNWFERWIFLPGKGLKLNEKFPFLKKTIIPRGASILLSWSVVAVAIYFLMSALLPELYRSILQLIENAESYYRTVAGWIQQFLNASPDARSWLVMLVEDYYQDALDFITTSLLPRAQSAVEAVTGGLLSFLYSVLDFLVGIIVSV